MKERTDSEIREKVLELWPNLLDWADESYFGVQRHGDYIDVKISSMYERPGLSFDQINALAEFFDTMKIETEEEITEEGCESCDHGSKYGFVLRASPGKPYERIPTENVG